MKKRHTAFHLNGGAGRIICAIPALEKFEQEHPDDDFVIAVDYGVDFFRGHPTLYKRAFDTYHKNLFVDKIKDRNLISPEPYHVWEYYNQQASIAQAFDIRINNKGVRELPPPTLVLSNEEYFGGINIVSKIKQDFGNKKTVVFQPFGRGANMTKDQTTFDMYGKSFFMDDAVELIKQIQKKYTVIVMSENAIDLKQFGYHDKIAQINDISLRQWMGVINAADHFLGCDSVGQHIAYALGKAGTIVLGSTFAENVSYPSYDKFDIIDLGIDKKMYSPIRISYDHVSDFHNEKIMRVGQKEIDLIMESLDKFLK